MAADIPIPPSFLTDVLQLCDEGSENANVSIYDGSGDHATPKSPNPLRPYVTLTFAQSLDAKIAGKEGAQLALSGQESFVMTHWMRTMHDAILVGIGTAINDNPQLNTRHLPPLPSDSKYRYHLPRPVILDTHLRFPLDRKLLKNYKAGTGRRPWIVGSAPQLAGAARTEWFARKDALELNGARVIEVGSERGVISLPEFLATLRKMGIRSLMVEGGARIIKSFLAEAEMSANAGSGQAVNAVDTVIVTVAPVLVGKDGVGYASDLLGDKLPLLQPVRTGLFGKDAVMALKVQV